MRIDSRKPETLPELDRLYRKACSEMRNKSSEDKHRISGEEGGIE